MGISTVKVPMGMRCSFFHPIKAEPAASHPTYEAKIDMGHAVKGYLSITTASAEIPGDDITQVSIERFVSGQLDVETTMSDLEVNARIYGHTYTEEDGETSNSSDAAPNGGYSCIEPILLKDKKVVFRTSCFYKTTAIASSEKQEADTKKSGELSTKNNAVSLKVLEDNTGDWRRRKEFDTFAEALAFIDTVFQSAAS